MITDSGIPTGVPLQMQLVVQLLGARGWVGLGAIVVGLAIAAFRSLPVFIREARERRWFAIAVEPAATAREAA